MTNVRSGTHPLSSSQHIIYAKVIRTCTKHNKRRAATYTINNALRAPTPLANTTSDTTKCEREYIYVWCECERAEQPVCVRCKIIYKNIYRISFAASSNRLPPRRHRRRHGSKAKNNCQCMCALLVMVVRQLFFTPQQFASSLANITFNCKRDVYEFTSKS